MNYNEAMAVIHDRCYAMCRPSWADSELRLEVNPTSRKVTLRRRRKEIGPYVPTADDRVANDWRIYRGRV